MASDLLPCRALDAGVISFAAGDAVTAADHFQTLVSESPHAEAHIFLISALARSNESEAAKRAYQKYRSQFPDISTSKKLELFAKCYPHFIDAMRTSLIEAGWDSTS